MVVLNLHEYLEQLHPKVPCIYYMQRSMGAIGNDVISQLCGLQLNPEFGLLSMRTSFVQVFPMNSISHGFLPSHKTC